MKSTRRRALYVIAALLGALFVLACLAGFAACGGSSEEEDGTKDDGTVQPTPSNPETTDCGDGNHKVSSWTVVTKASCTEAGSESGTCSVCGKTVTRTIEALGHDWGSDVVTAPTCKEGGYTTQTCLRCGLTQQINQTEKTTNHTWDSGVVTKEAACTEKGVMTYTCTVCGETKTDDIEATGHTWDEGTVTKEATYTAAGEKLYTCTVCGETKTETIAALKIEDFEDAEWSQIAEIAALGMAEDVYELGDTKTFETAEGEEIEVRIVDFGEYSITLETVTCLSTSYKMNNSATNAGGWAASDLRKTLNGDVYDSLPEDLQAVIVSSDVKSLSGLEESAATYATTSDKLFIPSVANIYSADAIEAGNLNVYKNYGKAYTEEGSQFEYYAQLDAQPTVGNSELARNKAYWLRSPELGDPNYFLIMNSSGQTNMFQASDSADVSFCFTVSESFADASWETISEIAQAGAASEVYSLGETKAVSTSDGEDLQVMIVDFGENDITLETASCLSASYAMNSAKSNEGGWAASDLRETLNGDVYNSLPEDLQAVIVSSDVKSISDLEESAATYATTSDKLFIPSVANIYSADAIEACSLNPFKTYASAYAAEDEQFGYYAQIDASPSVANEKLTNGTTYWLRSMMLGDSEYFETMNYTGQVNSQSAQYAAGVSFCFTVAGRFAASSWDEISEAAKSGEASDIYDLGDTKTITLTTDEDTTEEIDVRIVDFGESSITLETTSCLETSYKMNNSASNTGGWESSDLKTTLNGTVYQSLPDELQKVIVDTTVKSIKGLDASGNAEYSEASEKLYIPSVTNIYSADAIKACSLKPFNTYADAYAAEDEQFGYYAQIDASPSVANEKLTNGTTYWLRSMMLGDSEYFETMNYTGQVNSQSAQYAAGVSFCFAI